RIAVLPVLPRLLACNQLLRGAFRAGMRLLRFQATGLEVYVAHGWSVEPWPRKAPGEATAATQRCHHRSMPLSHTRISARVSAIHESATLAVDAKARALRAEGRPVIVFGV